MESLVVGNVAIFWLAYATLGVYCAFCARLWWQQWRSAGWGPLYRSMRARLLSLLKPLLLGNPTEDSESTEVRNLLEQCLLDRFRVGLAWIAPVCAVGLFCWLPATASRIESESRVRFPFVSIHVSVLAFQMLTSLFPKLLTLTSAHLFLTLDIALVACRIAAYDHPANLQVDLPLMIVVRFAASIFLTSLPLRLLANIVFGSLSCLTCVSIYNDDVSLHGAPYETNTLRIIILELFTTATILIVCSTVDMHMVSEVRARLMAKASTHAEVMANILLASLCDAIVHLDSSLRICKPSPTLATLLLNGSSSASLLGSDFLDFVDQLDHHHFAVIKSLTQAAAVNTGNDLDSNDVPAALTMHVHLLCSSGTRVRVELLLGTFSKVNGSISHIVGMRAICSSEGASCRVSKSNESAASQDQHDVHDDLCSVSPPPDLENPTVTLTIDADSTEYKIVGCVPTDVLLGEQSHNSDYLLQWLGQSEGTQLRQLITAFGNDVQYGTDDDFSRRADLGVWILEPPVAQLAGITYEASCSVEVELKPPDTDCSSDDLELVVRFIMADLRKHGRARHGQGSRGISQSPSTQVTPGSRLLRTRQFREESDPNIGAARMQQNL